GTVSPRWPTAGTDRLRAAFRPCAAPPALNPGIETSSLADTRVRGGNAMNYEQILSFWFEEIEPRQWWNVDPAFDALLRERYAQLLCQGARGELYEWRETPRGRLAEITVLDQFSRNIHRDTPQAYAQDGMALVLAQEAVAAGALDVLEQ